MNFLTRVFFFFLILVFPLTSTAKTHKEYFENHYNVLVNKLHNNGYPGPVSNELAKYALARQVLEDGITRKSGESVAGISVGGFNKEITNKVLKNAEISVSYATDSEGGRFYQFKGNNANIYSAMIISNLFDFYVSKFLKKHEKTWLTVKELSKAISINPDSFELNHKFYTTLYKEHVIIKANSLYGPGHTSVLQISDNVKYHDSFVFE